MFDKRFFARVAVAAAGSTAIAVALGGGLAQAQGSTTVTPADNAIFALSQGPVTFTVGQLIITCGESAAGGNVPMAPDNHSATGPVVLTFGPFDGSYCSTNVPDLTAGVTSGGPWPIAVQHGSPINATLTIPDGGMSISLRGPETRCSLGIAPNAPASVPATWVNGEPSTLVVDRVSVPMQPWGRYGCPTETSAVWSATYAMTNPMGSAAITVGP
ncbi:hypothetical protein [Nocardia suismassiliense]|uniref:hypothetical protein n=1 Tax=Nocardia suismassiliense TaxID=2077092 RepID=UPI000D1F498B|nr:hypothetical protein [Nocardia suismassiliense]